MNINEATNARMVAKVYEQEQAIQREEQRHKTALEEGAKASSKSIELLQQQLSELQEQNKTLSEGYDVAMKELEQAKKSGRIDRIIAIVSIIIAIASLIKSFIG